MKEIGLASQKLTKKPKLTKVMKQKRLAFTKKYQHWTVEQWKKVLFSNESSMHQFDVCTRRVHCPTVKIFDEKYSAYVVKHPQKQMV